jgi:hypothetical protein
MLTPRRPLLRRSRVFRREEERKRASPPLQKEMKLKNETQRNGKNFKLSLLLSLLSLLLRFSAIRFVIFGWYFDTV